MTSLLYKRAAEVIETEVGNEVVALDLQSGTCFALNEIAASVWRSLSEPRNFEDLRDGLLDAYEVPVEQCTIDLEELLDDLAEKGLVQKIA